ncbi:PilZ domain-containing protein [Singulisphaera rosea]
MNKPPKNQLLGFLRSRPRAVGEAFRTNPRHESHRRARLFWTEGDRTREIPIRLIDISRVGAAVSASTPPPTSALVRIRLVGPSATPWIEAIVIGVEANEGTYRVRLKFREPCPTVMLKAAVLDLSTPEVILDSEDSEDSD